MSVSAERTGWRDQALSLRHREWGYDCPAVDFDFVVAEYDSRRAVALIDYKRGLNYVVGANDRGNMAVLADLGNGYRGSGLPVYLVRYDGPPYVFMLEPWNDVAKLRTPEYAVHAQLSELRFVGFLYWLRGRRVPDEIARHLMTGAL